MSAAPLIAAGVGLANTAINSSLQRKQQDYTFKQQHAMMQYENSMNKSYQEWLWNNSTPRQLESYKKAGLNPANIDDGLSSDSLPSPKGSVSTAPMPNQGIDAGAMINAFLVDKQAQSMDEDIRKKRLENDILQYEKENIEGENDVFNSSTAYLDPDTGEEIKDVDSWSKKHPNKIPELVTIRKKGGKGRASASNQLGEYKTLSSERSAREDTADTIKAENDFKRVSASLQKKVARGQINNAAVIRALRNMPAKQYAMLESQLEKLGLEKTYQKLMNEYQDMSNKQFSETSMGRLIERLRDDDLSFGEKTLYTLTFIFNNLGSFMRPR